MPCKENLRLGHQVEAVKEYGLISWKVLVIVTAQRLHQHLWAGMSLAFGVKVGEIHKLQLIAAVNLDMVGVWDHVSVMGFHELVDAVAPGVEADGGAFAFIEYSPHLLRDEWDV